jgi:hypothetical protein
VIGGCPKDLKRLLRDAERQGFRVERCSGHFRVTPPNPAFPLIYVSITPSKSYTLHTIRGDLRRAGFKDERSR